MKYDIHVKRLDDPWRTVNIGYHKAAAINGDHVASEDVTHGCVVRGKRNLETLLEKTIPPDKVRPVLQIP